MVKNVGKLPPSYTYVEILDKIKDGYVAYCYMGGKNKESLLFKDLDGTIKIIPSGNESARSTFELWAFIHEIPNGIIRQNAVNKFYSFFNDYYKYLNLHKYNFILD